MLAVGVMSGVRAQDRGDANAQASIEGAAAVGPGGSWAGHERPPTGIDGRHAHSARRRERVRRRCGRGSGPERGRAAELEHRGKRLCHDVRQEDRPGALAGHGRSGAQGPGRVGDDARDPEHGAEPAVVPGNIGGLIAMLDRFGTRSLAEVLAPAIEYAEQGHPANDGFAAGVRSGQKLLSRAPTSAALFMPGGKLPASGEIVRNPDFASTLKKMADAEQSAVKRGATRAVALKAARDRFYKGTSPKTSTATSRPTAAR